MSQQEQQQQQQLCSSFFLKDQTHDALFSDLECAAFNVLSPQEVLLARVKHEYYPLRGGSIRSEDNAESDNFAASSDAASESVKVAFIESLLVLNNNSIVPYDSLRAIMGVPSSFSDNLTSSFTSATPSSSSSSSSSATSSSGNKPSASQKTVIISRLPNNSLLLTPACVIVSFWKEREIAEDFVQQYSRIDEKISQSSSDSRYWLQTLSRHSNCFVIGGTGIFATTVYLPPMRRQLFRPETSVRFQSNIEHGQKRKENDCGDGDDDGDGDVNWDLALELQTWKESVNNMFSSSSPSSSLPQTDVFLHPHSFSIADGCEGVPILIRPSREMLMLAAKANKDAVGQSEDDEQNRKWQKIKCLSKKVQNFLLSDSTLREMDEAANTFNRRTAWQWLRHKLNCDVFAKLSAQQDAGEDDLFDFMALMNNRIRADDEQDSLTKHAEKAKLLLLRELGIFVRASDSMQNQFCLDPDGSQHPKLQVILPAPSTLDSNVKALVASSAAADAANSDSSFSKRQRRWILDRNEDSNVAPLHVVDLMKLRNAKIGGKQENQGDNEKTKKMKTTLSAVNFQQRRKEIERHIERFVWRGQGRGGGAGAGAEEELSDDDEDDNFFHSSSHGKCPCCAQTMTIEIPNLFDDDDDDNEQEENECAKQESTKFLLTRPPAPPKNDENEEAEVNITPQYDDDDDDDDGKSDSGNNRCGWVTLHSMACDYLSNRLSERITNNVGSGTSKNPRRCCLEWSSISLLMIEFVKNEIKRVESFNDQNTLFHHHHRHHRKGAATTNADVKTRRRKTLSSLHASVFGVALRLLMFSGCHSNGSKQLPSLTSALLPCFFYYYKKTVQENIAKFFLNIFVADECDRNMFLASTDSPDPAAPSSTDNNNPTPTTTNNNFIVPKLPTSNQAAENVVNAISSLVSHFEDFDILQRQQQKSSLSPSLLSSPSSSSSAKTRSVSLVVFLSFLQKSILLPLAFTCLKSPLGAPHLLLAETLSDILAFKYCPLVAKMVSEEVGRRLSVVRKRGDLFVDASVLSSSPSSSSRNSMTCPMSWNATAAATTTTATASGALTTPRKRQQVLTANQQQHQQQESSKTMMSLLYSSSLMLLGTTSASSPSSSPNQSATIYNNSFLMNLLLTAGFAALSLMCPTLDYRSMVKPNHLEFSVDPRRSHERQVNGTMIIYTSRLRRMLWKILHLVGSVGANDDSIGKNANNNNSNSANSTKKLLLHSLVFEDLPILIVSCSVILQRQRRQCSDDGDAIPFTTKEKALYFIMDHVAVSYAHSCSTSPTATSPPSSSSSSSSSSSLPPKAAAARRIQRCLRAKLDFQLNVALLTELRRFERTVREESVAHSSVLRWKIERHTLQQDFEKSQHDYADGGGAGGDPVLAQPLDTAQTHCSARIQELLQSAVSASSPASSYLDPRTFEIICPPLKKLLMARHQQQQEQQEAENSAPATTTAVTAATNLKLLLEAVADNHFAELRKKEQQRARLRWLQQHQHEAEDQGDDEQREQQQKQDEFSLSGEQNVSGSEIVDYEEDVSFAELCESKRQKQHQQRQQRHREETNISTSKTTVSPTSPASMITTRKTRQASRQTGRSKNRLLPSSSLFNDLKNQIQNTKESTSARRVRDHQPPTLTPPFSTKDNNFVKYELNEKIELRDYRDVAAIRIQSCWRCFVARTDLKLLMWEKLYHLSQ